MVKELRAASHAFPRGDAVGVARAPLATGRELMRLRAVVRPRFSQR